MLLIFKACVPLRRKRCLSIGIALATVICILSLKVHHEEKAQRLKHEREINRMIQEGVGKAIIQSPVDAGPGPKTMNGKLETTMDKNNFNESQNLNEIPTRISFQKQRDAVIANAQGMSIVVDAIYWSPEVEKLVPPGYTDKDYQDFVYETSHQSVVTIEKSTTSRCGRNQNKYLHLARGTALCARYRNSIENVYGELLSFHLSRMLGLDNVPLVVLSRVNSSAPSPLWSNMRGEIRRAGWHEGKLVALIRWIDELSSVKISRAYMPPLLLEAYETNQTLMWNSPGLKNATSMDLQSLMQWSDLIVFDYITANCDRVANMQDIALKEHKPSIMHEEMWNLPASPNTGKLWLIDNECGLQEGYRGLKYKPTFISFHKQMLESICVFHKRTIENLRDLAASVDPSDVLLKYARDHEPLFDETHIKAASRRLRMSFQERLYEVMSWVGQCAKQYRADHFYI